MQTEKTKEATYTKDQVRNLVAEVFTDLVFELEDASLVIAGKLGMIFLDKKLK